MSSKTSWKKKNFYTADVLKTSSRRLKDQQMFAGTCQCQQNRLQTGGAMQHGKVLLATLVVWLEDFLNSKRSRLAKTVTLSPWWQPFDSFWFETVFFPRFSFFFPTQKMGQEHYPPPPPLLSPVLSVTFNRILLKLVLSENIDWC